MADARANAQRCGGMATVNGTSAGLRGPPATEAERPSQSDCEGLSHVRNHASAASLVWFELVVAVAVVDRVDRDTGCDDLVDAVEHVRAQGDVGGWEERL